jgi:hypothetical protein
MKVWVLVALVMFALSSAGSARASNPMTFKMDNDLIVADGDIMPDTADQFRAFLRLNGRLGQQWSTVMLL